ncbi:hypothetical protein G9A89_019894 [Geosiphon pyriformis]|nr:hypothetical protein G9A89_019894 [Geosiphon pyriformis]
MSRILRANDYFDVVHSLKCFGIAFEDVLITKHGQVINWKTFWHWKKLSPRGPVPLWFTRAFVHVNGFLASSGISETGASCSEFFCSDNYLCIYKHLHEVWARELNVYTNGSLSGLGIGEVACGAAVFFFEVDMGVGVRVQGLLSSTLVELQTIVLALECILSSCSVVLHSDSQGTLDACVLENISVRWVKVKEHSSIMGNNHVDAFAHAIVHFNLALPVGISDRFLIVDGFAISGNARHFVHDIYYAINRVLWEAGPGVNVLDSLDIRHID